MVFRGKQKHKSSPSSSSSSSRISTTNNNNSDELSTVKAAAWARYQHGSTESKSRVNEYTFTTIHKLLPNNNNNNSDYNSYYYYKPSRYKLEAMRLSTSSAASDHQGCNIDGTAANSLLDKYEILSISKHLDQLLEDEHRHRLDHGRTVSSDGNGQNTSGVMMKKEKGKKKVVRGGIWLRPTAICGTREDVVESIRSSDVGRWWRP